MYFLYESFKIEKLKTKGRLALVLDETPYLILSRWRELNPRPLPYQGSALPLSYIGKRVEDGTSRFTSDLTFSPVQHCVKILKSGRRDSNPRPSAWKANALSTELLPQN